VTPDLAGSRASAFSGREGYFLGVLLLINTVNYLDRQVINILNEPIRLELKLDDWQIGAISGLSFALLYTIVGLPLARIAERIHRPTLLGVSIGVWSAFTLLCGAAGSFWQLAAFRTGVGLGEGAAAPICYSLIADRVDKAKRATAIAIFASGTSIGALAGMALGGIVADHYGWRTAFLVAGLPGIVLAIVTAKTLSEPRGDLGGFNLRSMLAPPANTPSIMATLRELASSKSFPIITFASATGGLVNFVHSAFFAAFMMRVHPEELKHLASTLGNAMGVSTPVGFVGITLGLTTGVMGIIGTILGGWLADQMARRRGHGVYMTIPAIAKLTAMPIAVAALLAPNVLTALMLVCVLNLIRSATHGPALGSIYALVRPEIRPTTSAIMVFVIAVIGLGIGPIAVGFLSDTLAASGWGEADGLRIALICAEGMGIIGAILFLIARPIYVREAKY
jgi:MFS family permease